MTPIPECSYRGSGSFPSASIGNLGSTVPTRNYFVYIITNYKRTTLYIGVTNNLYRRMYEHKNGLIAGFSKKYSLKYLVYYEVMNDIVSAIRREKQLKKWNRSWKNDIINKFNLKWKDLSVEWDS